MFAKEKTWFKYAYGKRISFEMLWSRKGGEVKDEDRKKKKWEVRDITTIIYLSSSKDLPHCEKYKSTWLLDGFDNEVIQKAKNKRKLFGARISCPLNSKQWCNRYHVVPDSATSLKASTETVSHLHSHYDPIWNILNNESVLGEHQF